jgi:YD repeat-containing protein
MKIKHQLWLVPAFVVLIAACKKTGDSGNNETPTVKKYVTEMVVVSIAPGIGKVTSVTDYTYDEKKRKKTEKVDNFTFTYAYYDNDKLFSSTQLVGDGNALRFYSEYTYTGTQLTRFKKITYRNNENALETTTDYVYDGNNRVTEEHSSGSLVLYTYDGNGDAVKVVETRPDGTITTTTTYDTNHRKITIIKSTAIQGIPNTSTTYTYDSHDNITKSVIVTGTTTTTTATVNLTNTYDADGYLISVEGSDGSSKTYTYKTL